MFRDIPIIIINSDPFRLATNNNTQTGAKMTTELRPFVTWFTLYWPWVRAS